MTSPAQIKAIHTLKSRAGLADDEFRAVLFKASQKRSSTQLSETEAGRVIDTLKALAGQSPGRAGRSTAATASGPYAPVLQALWIAAWNLGLARLKDDRAMMKFVERQTKITHTRFLNDAADARRAIEGLKAWIVRAGGVVWSEKPKFVTGPWDRTLESKQAVVKAIARRLMEAGGFTAFIAEKGFASAWPSDFEAYAHQRCGCPIGGMAHYTPQNWDDLANALGARLRATLAGKKEKAA